MVLIKQIRIFVAAPGDNQDLRLIIDDVAHDLNDLWQHTGMQLAVQHWHQVTFPIGQTAQSLILKQFNPTNWDIFVCVLWHRFGTPTMDLDPTTGVSYRSGTEQEFLKALDELNSRGLPMLLYQRDTPLKPSSIAPDQLKLVQEFFNKFKPGGQYIGYVPQFDNVTDFKKKLQKDVAEVARTL